jgi:hypothetical protein
MPEQYVGGAERTTPLEDGAKAVLGALALIKHRIATALGKDVSFNEVLSAAYMEKQRMAVSDLYLHPAIVPNKYRSSTAIVSGVWVPSSPLFPLVLSLRCIFAFTQNIWIRKVTGRLR